MSRPPITENAAHPDKVREAERKVKSLREQELNDFAFIMNSPQGRRFVARLLDTTGFQRSSFTGNSTTFWNEGRRAVGLEIWADANEFPDLLMLMFREQKEYNDRSRVR